MSTGTFPYAGPAPVFLSEFDPDTGELLTIPIQLTPPGGEPYIGLDPHVDHVGNHVDPPFSQAHDLAHVDHAIFGVKKEGFVQEWEGPWIPDVEVLGPPMRTPLAGGHAAAVVFDPLSEFGVGREPAFLYARWEVDESPNPYWRHGVDARFGGKPLGDANPQAVLYEDIQDQSMTDYQLQWAQYRNRGGGRHGVVVPVPASGSLTGNLAAVPNVTSLDNLMPDTTDVY